MTEPTKTRGQALEELVDGFTVAIPDLNVAIVVQHTPRETRVHAIGAQPGQKGPAKDPRQRIAVAMEPTPELLAELQKMHVAALQALRAMVQRKAAAEYFGQRIPEFVAANPKEVEPEPPIEAEPVQAIERNR